MSDQPASLCLQLAAIPKPVLSAWRSRYAAEGGIELAAFALVDMARNCLRFSDNPGHDLTKYVGGPNRAVPSPGQGLS